LSDATAARLPTEQHVDAPVPHGRRLVGVQFRRASVMVYDFDARGFDLSHDARVVVETDRGEAMGWTVGVPEHRAPHAPEEVRRVLRLATPQDLARDVQLHERERVSLRHCAQKARQLGLPMKVVAAEWQHSGDKVTFYFSSEDRVDFRQLVRDLAQHNRARVEMRQVGPRDEAKIIGAMGPCGRETCCTSWMRSFSQVSIRHAKDQGLGLNPAKVTGVCGRLMCCLAYEQETYQELRKGLPRYGKMVSTPMGPGKVIDVLTLRRAVKVSVEGKWMEFPADEVTPLNIVPGASGDDETDGDVTESVKPQLSSAIPGVRPGRPSMGDRSRPSREAPRPTPAESREPTPARSPQPPRPEASMPPAGANPSAARPERHQRRPQRGPDAPAPREGARPAVTPQAARPSRPPPPPRPAEPRPAVANVPTPGDDSTATEAAAPGTEGERQRSRRRRGRRGRGGGGSSGEGGGPADGGSTPEGA
jgi:cell fate regulator YaaT (PSP1 superfamily)